MRAANSTKPLPLPEPKANILRHMWPKIKIPDGCWEWSGSLTMEGYATNVSVNGTSGPDRERHLPHRLIFQWFKWDIPDGMTIDHLCKNRKCMNPDHMEAVTAGENVRRGLKRAYCKRGHPQTPENRYVYKANGRTRERCRPCIPIQAGAWQAKVRASESRKGNE